jgi:hypothetical protein
VSLVVARLLAVAAEAACDPVFVGLVEGAFFAVVLVAGAVLALFRAVVTSDRAVGLALVLERTFAFEGLLVAALVAEALAFDDLVEAVALDLAAFVAAFAPDLVAAAPLAVLVAAVVVARVLVVTVLVAAVLPPGLTPADFEVVALLLFAVFALAALRVADFAVSDFPPAAFAVVRDVPLAALDEPVVVEFADDFRVELVVVPAAMLVELVFAAGFAAADGLAARFEVGDDTVVRDRAAANTLLRPAESAADTATHTPASLRKRSSCLAWGAGIPALSHTPRTSCALTWPDS